MHPHGTLTLSRIFWRSPNLERLFDRPWRMLAASVLYAIPIVREMTNAFGAIDACKARTESEDRPDRPKRPKTACAAINIYRRWSIQPRICVLK